MDAALHLIVGCAVSRVDVAALEFFDIVHADHQPQIRDYLVCTAQRQEPRSGLALINRLVAMRNTSACPLLR